MHLYSHFLHQIAQFCSQFHLHPPAGLSIEQETCRDAYREHLFQAQRLGAELGFIAGIAFALLMVFVAYQAAKGVRDWWHSGDRGRAR